MASALSRGMTRTITRAELRNGRAGVMDEPEAGQDFVVTRNGWPVRAEISPSEPDDYREAPPRRRMTARSVMARRSSSVSAPAARARAREMVKPSAKASITRGSM